MKILTFIVDFTLWVIPLAFCQILWQRKSKNIPIRCWCQYSYLSFRFLKTNNRNRRGQSKSMLKIEVKMLNNYNQLCVYCKETDLKLMLQNSDVGMTRQIYIYTYYYAAFYYQIKKLVAIRQQYYVLSFINRHGLYRRRCKWRFRSKSSQCFYFVVRHFVTTARSRELWVIWGNRKHLCLE